MEDNEADVQPMETDSSQHHVPLPELNDESNVNMGTYDTSVTEAEEFSMVPNGTERGKDLLVERPGYSYTVRKQTTTTRFWWCSVRRQGDRCPASISERGGKFIRGAHSHLHPADPACLLQKQMSRQVKDTAADNIFDAAMLIVQNKIQAQPPHSDHLIKPDLLARTANRYHQNQRPADPQEMDFELATDRIPEDFLQADITVEGAHHVLFSTPQQLDLLSKAKTWYLDGTFKVIRTKDVFDQLFGIHAFIRKDDVIKQVPLAFVFMSRKRSKDYKKVLKKVKNALSGERVTTFVLDFEAAVWKAIRSVFPDATVRGCAFHWKQAVYRRIQACGLAAQYCQPGRVQTLLRQLLALPMLPATVIPEMFAGNREDGRGRGLH